MAHMQAESVFVLPYHTKEHTEAVNNGLAGLLGSRARSASFSTFGTLTGTRQAQLEQYFGAVACAVRYRAQIMGQVPTIVRAGTSIERQKSAYDRKAWEYRFKAFMGGSGVDPGVPPERRWVSQTKKKGLAGSHRTQEELEYLDAEHPLVKLVVNPNQPQIGLQFWQLNNIYLDLCGVSYIWVVPDKSGKPVSMWLIPPSWVDDNPVDGNSDVGDLFGSYTVRSPYGGTMDLPNFDPESSQERGGVIRLAYDSPLSMLVPDSRVFAHRFDVDMLGMIQNARYCSLQNGGEIGTVFSINPNVTISDENMKRFVAQFSSAYAGVFNQNRLTYLPPGVEIERPPPGREAAYSDSEQKAWERVFEVFDLDYQAMVRAGSSSYAAPAIARKNFRFHVSKPRQDYVAAVLTEKLFRVYGEEYRAVFEDEGGYVDPQERRADWTLAINNPLGPVVTVNEIRTELLNLEPNDDPAADVLFVKPGMVPLSDALEAGDDAGGKPAQPSVMDRLFGNKPKETAAPGAAAEGEPAKENVRANVVEKAAGYRPPKSARNNAKKAIAWKEKYGDEVKGGTQVGWTRAHQLANGENLSLSTVKRMASFNRHRKNSKVKPEFASEPWKDAGYVAWLLWGGTSGVNWAIGVSQAAREKNVRANVVQKYNENRDDHGRFASTNTHADKLSEWKKRQADFQAKIDHVDAVDRSTSFEFPDTSNGMTESEAIDALKDKVIEQIPDLSESHKKDLQRRVEAAQRAIKSKLDKHAKKVESVKAKADAIRAQVAAMRENGPETPEHPGYDSAGPEPTVPDEPDEKPSRSDYDTDADYESGLSEWLAASTAYREASKEHSSWERRCERIDQKYEAALDKASEKHDERMDALLEKADELEDSLEEPDLSEILSELQSDVSDTLQDHASSIQDQMDADEEPEEPDSDDEEVEKILRDSWGRFCETGSEHVQAACRHVMSKLDAVAPSVKTLAYKAGKGAAKLAAGAHELALSANVSPEWVSQFMDGVIQAEAIKHVDTVRGMTGLDSQTAMEIALHVATYARLKFRDYYAKRSRSGVGSPTSTNGN